MRKLMMLAAMLAVALLAASPALAQDEPAVVADAKANVAGAGGAKAEAECKDGVVTAQAGGVVAKAPCEPESPKAAPPPPPPKAAPPPPPPKAAPAPAPAPAPKQLPASGGSSVASLFALGAGALLVGGGLLARRLIR